MVRNAISVDVEDWFQVGAFEGVISRDDWHRYTHRVEANTDAVLALFDEAGVKGTFFTLGWVAERYPALIRRMAENGHEVASHGCDHRRVHQLTAKEFAADIAKSKDVLEQASGMAVKGYRAPNFSIDKRTPWAHQALIDAGYLYSSSVAPVIHDHYGWPEAPRFAYQPFAGTDFVELPVSTIQMKGRNFAAGGGGFFRALPYVVSRWMVGKVIREDHGHVFYFHPWDMDPGQPKITQAPLKSRLRHYTNLSKMAPKLRRLMQDFEWGRVDHLIEAERGKLQ